MGRHMSPWFAGRAWRHGAVCTWGVILGLGEGAKGCEMEKQSSRVEADFYGAGKGGRAGLGFSCIEATAGPWFLISILTNGLEAAGRTQGLFLSPGRCCSSTAHGDATGHSPLPAGLPPPRRCPRGPARWPGHGMALSGCVLTCGNKTSPSELWSSANTVSCLLWGWQLGWALG